MYKNLSELKKFVYLFFVLSMFIFIGCLNAEVFNLRNGETIEGELLNEDSTCFVVKIKYGTIRIDKTEVKPQINQDTVKEFKKTDLKSAQLFKKTSSNPEMISSENLSRLQKWLSNQINPKTGLLESYRPTADAYLEKQAATYDQALAGLAFIELNDLKKAQDILDFYKTKWEGDGFSNFYFTNTGTPGIEASAHLGPNLWIAILALHYERITGKNDYKKLAEDIVKWAMSLPHYRGGAAMSNHDEWRASWTKVVSTENNIDYYAVLDTLSQNTQDPEFKEKLEREKNGIIDFIEKVAYDKQTGLINSGYHAGLVDRKKALDTVTWLIAAVGIDELRKWNIAYGKDRDKSLVSPDDETKQMTYFKIDLDKLINNTENRFLVKDDGIKGFDFTDKKGAFKAKRKRMISIEWTLGMVNVYAIYKNYYNKLADEQEKLSNRRKANALYKKAHIYENKILFYLKQVDMKMLKFGAQKDLYAYPYATRSYWQVFHDSSWWKTPKAGTDGTPAGSVASTTWRIFAGKFNPLNKKGELE